MRKVFSIVLEDGTSYPFSPAVLLHLHPLHTVCTQAKLMTVAWMYVRVLGKAEEPNHHRVKEIDYCHAEDEKSAREISGISN
ncbi:hypothetical protein CEXT_654981 [Caerostris extrusa]|uniref:Uncharacterized protein n=1 Tax=Caerostris extrusa TaxID=172846 RepID=A0AAV4XIP1_CAEEX|nr:hypothetical protein CEXT_654981 [Caerostris extrusa]